MMGSMMARFARIFGGSLPVAAVIAAAVLPAASPARADVIELKDGTRITGKMVRQGPVMRITPEEAGAKPVFISPDDVVRVTLTSNLTPAEAADAAWVRTQNDIRKADKFSDVLAALEKFAATHAGTPAAETAQKMLEAHQQIEKQDPVKFHGRWMPQAQVEVVQKQAEEKAQPAVAAYKAGKLKEAIDLAKEALKVDEENTTALVVTALAQYRTNQLQYARTTLLKIIEAEPSHLLALNNLGVISYQLKRDPDGIGHYGKALQAAPENRFLLDNIAEAVHAYTGNRNTQLFRDFLRQYEQAEAGLQANMAKKGLYRWGSTWVTQEQKDRLQQNKQTVKTAMTTLETQFTQAVRQAEGLDLQIKQAAADYDAALNDFNYWSAQLGLVLPYDPWAASRRDAALRDAERAKRRKAALEDQKAALGESVRKMRADAQKLQTQFAQLDKDQYTGVQRIMDLGDVEQLPPPAAVNVPAKIDPPPSVKMERVVEVPQRETPRPSYEYPNYGTWYTPMYPGIPIVTPPVVVVPPGQGGVYPAPGGGWPIIIIPGTPQQPQQPAQPPKPTKPPESRKLTGATL